MERRLPLKPLWLSCFFPCAGFLDEVLYLLFLLDDVSLVVCLGYSMDLLFP